MPTAENILGTRENALERIMALSGSDETLMRGALAPRFDRARPYDPNDPRDNPFVNRHSLGDDGLTPIFNALRPFDEDEQGRIVFNPMNLFGGPAGAVSAGALGVVGRASAGAFRNAINRYVANIKRLLSDGKKAEALLEREKFFNEVHSPIEQSWLRRPKLKGRKHPTLFRQADQALDEIDDSIRSANISVGKAATAGTASVHTSPTGTLGQQPMPSSGTPGRMAPGAFYPTPQRPWVGPGAAGRAVPKTEAAAVRPRTTTPIGGADIETLAKSAGAQTTQQAGKLRRMLDAAKPKGVGGWLGAALTVQVGYQMVKDGLDWALGDKPEEPAGPRPGQTAVDAMTASDAAIGRRSSDTQLLFEGMRQRLKDDLERDYDPAWFDAVFAGRANNSIFSMVAPQTTRDVVANELRAALLSAQAQQGQPELSDAEMAELER